MKPLLKKALSVGIPALAIPAYIVFAQTTPTPTPTTSSVPFIPLFVTGTTSGTATTGASSWFIDVAKQQIMACTQGGGAAPTTITCTGSPLPTAASGTPSTPSTPAP